MKPYKVRQKNCYRAHLRNLFGEDWKKHFDEQDCKDYVIGNKRAVEQIEIKTGNVIAVFGSLSEAAKKMNVSIKTIWKVCNGELFTACGYRWRYDNFDFWNPECYVSGNVGRPGKQVEQIDVVKNEVVKIWTSVKEAQKITGISNIDKCCRGERETAKGFKWRYLENGKLESA